MTPQLDPAPQRILVGATSVPCPPLDGLGLIVAELVPELRGRGRTVRVVGLGTGASSGDVRVVPRERLSRRARAWGTVRSGLTCPPSVAVAVRGLGPALADEVATFGPDAVLLVGPHLAPLRALADGRPCLLVAVDSWYRNRASEVGLRRGLRRLAGRVELTTIRRHLERHWSGFETIVVVSEEDAREVRRLVPGPEVVAIPNGVRIPARSGPIQRHAAEVVFHGTLDYLPNVRAAVRLATRILPRVREVEPAARLRLVGRNPSPAVRDLARHPYVEVVGTVPDVHPELDRATVYACSMESGSGIKNKVLEAMASGLPVVSTPLGLQGIGARPDHDVLVGSSDDELATLVARVLRDPDLAERIGAGGRRYVEANHSWSTVAERYLAALVRA